MRLVGSSFRNCHNIIRRSVGIPVKIDIHGNLVLVPDAGIDMELSVLQAVRIGYGVSILTMVVPCSTPVACAVEIAVLRTVGDAGSVTELHNVGLTATRPAYLVEIVAHHPKRRPQTVGSLRQLDGSLYLAMLERYFVLRRDASGSALLPVVHFFLCCKDKAAVALAVVADTDIFQTGSVILQLVVAATVAVHLNVPTVEIKRLPVEQILPHQFITVGLSSTDLRFCRYCRQRHRHQGRCNQSSSFHIIKFLYFPIIAALLQDHRLWVIGQTS